MKKAQSGNSTPGLKGDNQMSKKSAPKSVYHKESIMRNHVTQIQRIDTIIEILKEEKNRGAVRNIDGIVDHLIDRIEMARVAVRAGNVDLANRIATEVLKSLECVYAS